MLKIIKKLLFIFFTTLCLSPALSWGQGQSVVFFDGTVYEALELAQSQDKMLLVEFYAKWNHKSRWMHEMIERAKGLSDNFLFCSVDTQTKEGAGLALTYSVNNYPMIVVFDTRGNAVAKIDQTLEEADFKAQLSTLTISNNIYLVQKLKQIYAIASSPDLAAPKELDSLVNNYLMEQSREYLLLPQHWELFSTPTITYYGSSAYDYLLSNYSDFQDPERARGEIERICYEDVLNYVTGSRVLDSLTRAQLEEMQQDSLTIEVASELNSLIELALIRDRGEREMWVQKLNKMVGKMSENYEYQLVISLDFVADYLGSLSRESRVEGRRMLENLLQKVTSEAKIKLIEQLLIKFS